LRKIPNHTLARRLIGAWQKKPEPPPVPAAAPAEPPALTEPVPPGGK
jgi:hypothetical protein